MLFWLVSKVSNSPTLEPSVKKSRCDMKKRRALLGGVIRWSIKRKKNYLHISYRSICGDQSRLRQSDAYLRIYSILKTSPNKFDSFILIYFSKFPFSTDAKRPVLGGNFGSKQKTDAKCPVLEGNFSAEGAKGRLLKNV